MLQDCSWYLLSDNVVVAFVSDSIDGIGVHPTKTGQCVVSMSATCDPACLDSVACDFCRINLRTDGLQVHVFKLGSTIRFEIRCTVLVVCSLDVLSHERKGDALDERKSAVCFLN